MSKKLVYFSLITILFSCSGKFSKIDDLNWLEGKWHSKVQGNDVTESWKKLNDSTWAGESAFVKDGEMLFSETMEIQMRNDELKFVTSISDQNEGKEVTFQTIENTSNKIVFENKAHDFPQQIVYEKNHKDSLLAYISGQFAGKYQRIDFRMSKTK